MGALRRRGARDWQLTDAEVKYLHGDRRMPEAARELLDREGGSLTSRVATLRAMRERLEEERRLADEYARFEGFRDRETQLEATQASERMVRDELAAAKREIAGLRQQLRAATARPALAVDAEPTGR